MQDKRLVRVDSTQLRLGDGVAGSPRFPVRIFANDRVPVESAAVDELLSVLDSQATLDQYANDPPQIEEAIVTPDFHKGSGIPIGSVLKTRGVIFPQAVGNDINCGMRLHTTDLDAKSVSRHLDRFETAARHLFFAGGRQIPMTGKDRETMLQCGLAGVFARNPWDRLDGQWECVVRHGWHKQLDRIERRGSLGASGTGIDAFDGWIRGGNAAGVSYDDQTGSIGGGNHFVEIQRVERILDRKTAYAWGLKQGSVAIMVHSGSVGIGHTAGRFIREAVRSSYPAGRPHPANGIFPLIANDADPVVQQFWNLLHSAANFAFANRLFLAASAVEALERALGSSAAFAAPLLYDSPHNLVWPTDDGGFLHRKGATPARGMGAMEGTPFYAWGEPVLTPGSMGASSFVLAGCGNEVALESASHGAGRTLSRGAASRSSQREFAEFLAKFRVVTPLDLRQRQRWHEVMRRKVEELRAEGPHAYKGIGPIIETLEEAKIARPVAELVPLATVKG